MAKKRSQRQDMTERQKKRQRSGSNITPSLETTANRTMQPLTFFDADCGTGADQTPPSRVIETELLSRLPCLLESVAAKRSPLVPSIVLAYGMSRPTSIADSISKSLEGQLSGASTASTTSYPRDDCSSSSSVRYDSEESCLSLPMLAAEASECHDNEDVQRLLENERIQAAYDESNNKKCVRFSSSTIALFGLIMLVCLCTSFGHDLTASVSVVIDKYRAKVERDSVCVSGGGFSGFWFILGRLQSIPDPANKNYYCFSAGCLGLVASLQGIAMDDVHSMAVDAQTKWKTGEIARHEVLTSFVDFLVYHNVANETSDTGIGQQQDLPFLNRLNVLTTIRDGRLGLKTSTRTPTSVDSLRTLLIQSAWIPFVVGNELFHEDHMDGAFYLFGHPRCEHSIGLPGNLDILVNVLNVNLSANKVQKFWKMGIERGL